MPATFKSSRSSKAAGAAPPPGDGDPDAPAAPAAAPGPYRAGGQQDLDYFLDEDEREERGRLGLRLAPDYDTFGDAAAQAARARARRPTRRPPARAGRSYRGP